MWNDYGSLVYFSLSVRYKYTQSLFLLEPAEKIVKIESYTFKSILSLHQEYTVNHRAVVDVYSVMCGWWCIKLASPLVITFFSFKSIPTTEWTHTTSTNTLVCIQNIILSITHSLEIKWKMPTKSRKNDSPEQLSRVVDVLLTIFLNKKYEWANLRLR